MFQKAYIVLKEADIRHRQEENISHVSAVLSISRDAASILLCHYKWYVLPKSKIMSFCRVSRTI